MSVTIKNKPKDVLPFLPAVKVGADAAKEELGFLPRKVYDEAATSGKLLVATVNHQGTEIYAGHLMFGGIYPRAKIFQLFVTPQFRGKRISRQMIDALKEQLTHSQWLSIKADVASDLSANAVWSQLGFRIVRTKPGGSVRNRRINIRVLELDTPSLLGYMPNPSHSAALRLAERFSQRPIYLIDLNVLFDTVRKRPRSVSAAKVIRAAMSNSVRLMVAAEFTQELTRTSNDLNNDPILSFSKQLEYLSTPSQKEVRSLCLDLGKIIFPDRANKDTLTDQDKSDLTHIATAIFHGVAGFITSEKAILQARSYFHEKWRLDVVGVEEFARVVDSNERVPRLTINNIIGGHLKIRRNYEPDIATARKFLELMRADPAFIQESIAYHGSQAQWLLVADETAPLGFAKWNVHGGIRRTADVYLCVDELNHAAEIILDHFFDIIPRKLSEIAPTLICLNILNGHEMTRQSALSTGFSLPYGASSDGLKLQRLAVGRIVSSENWTSVRQSLTSVASLSLPAQMPTFAAAKERLLCNTGGREIELPLAEMERFLSPVLFLFSERHGVIVPIQEQFARELIGASPQLSMLAPPEALLRRERVYINTPRTIACMVPGTPILFYESRKGNGRGCAIAVARITDSRIVSKADALSKAQRHGVLDDRTLEKRSVGREVTEASFDNIFIFGSPVPLKRLREIGCVDRSNLVSARRIAFDKLLQITKEGNIDGWR